jgi:hypothetical protein
MACDHVGGPELIEMTEEHLRAAAIPEPEWAGRRYRWAENLEESMWASVVIEIERRGDAWIVVRLDRNREKVEETGFRQV